MPTPLSLLAALDQALLLAGPDGVILQANEPAARLLGVPVQALAGLAADEAMPGLGNLARDGLEPGRAAGRVILTAGGRTLACTPRSVGKGGTDGGDAVLVLLEEARPDAEILSGPEPADGLPGNPGGEAGRGPDLPAYERLERQFRAVFDASSDGMWVCDGAGAILEINRASEKLNDVRGADFIGKDVECIIREGLVDRSVTLDVLKERRQVSMIQRITRTGRQLLVTGTPVFDEAGGIFLVVVNERDITELNHLRENLQEARQVQEKIQTELARLTLLELRKKEIVAESAQMRQVLSSALKLAHMGVSNILILGESGTGKGLLAKLVHRHSPRSEQPFIQINCAALPESLFEAELFGYETGAFTGAREGGKAGLIELAAGGTLFLDEIGEIPLSVQAKLLKYLDDHELTRLGGGRPRKVECAVVAATNRNLEVLVRQGKFRKDLYYRLNTFTVSIPPLREREADVFELADAYLRTFNRKYGLARRLSPKAMRLLKSHPFPGNVRELVGIIQKAVVMSDSDVLDEAIEESLTGRSPRPAARTGLGRSLPEARAGLELESLKRAMLACATTREMARYLGVSQATVVRKLKKHGLARQ